MAPSPCIELDAAEQGYLLRLARQQIARRLLPEQELAGMKDLDEYMALKGDCHGVFVTLRHNRQLRGCIGSMLANCNLENEVKDAAYSAAFKDRRFAPVTAAELEQLSIEISVLSELQAIAAADRTDLLAALRPGVDGILLEDGRNHRATFLPKVWEQLPEPEQFLAQLLLKAGLASDYWSPTLHCSRYQTLTFAEPE